VSASAPFVGSAVGLTIELDAVQKLLRGREDWQAQARKNSAAEVFVCSIGQNMDSARARLATKFWDAGISADFSYKQIEEDPLARARDLGCSFVVVMNFKTWAKAQDSSLDELDGFVVKVRCLDPSQKAGNSSGSARRVGREEEKDEMVKDVIRLVLAERRTNLKILRDASLGGA